MRWCSPRGRPSTLRILTRPCRQLRRHSPRVTTPPPLKSCAAPSNCIPVKCCRKMVRPSGWRTPGRGTVCGPPKLRRHWPVSNSSWATLPMRPPPRPGVSKSTPGGMNPGGPLSRRSAVSGTLRRRSVHRGATGSSSARLEYSLFGVPVPKSTRGRWSRSRPSSGAPKPASCAARELDLRDGQGLRRRIRPLEDIEPHGGDPVSPDVKALRTGFVFMQRNGPG